MDNKCLCKGCGYELTEDDVHSGVHFMTHQLLEKLNIMPMEYGFIAMTQLLVSQSPLSKEDFLKQMESSWDISHRNNKKD